MVDNKKIVVVLPAYNAEKTVARTLSEVPPGIVDLFILVDDHSSDRTVEVSKVLGNRYPLKVIEHRVNLGYGGNQKTCYEAALKEGADVVIMLHPDYQYAPALVGCFAQMICSGIYDVVLGSRILGRGALLGGMPLYKYVANRILTFIENLLIGQKLSEYHTGYRAFSRKVLETIPFQKNSNAFVFDNEMLVQVHLAGFRIGEISVPTRYFEEASSIGFLKSVRYGFGVLRCSLWGFVGRFRRSST